MNWKKWFKLLGFFLLLALAFFWARSDFWAIEKITCRLDDQDCPPDLLAKTTELSLGKNLIFFPKQSFEQNIQNNFPQTGEIKIKKGFFKNISFFIASQKAVAALAVQLPLSNEATSSGQEFSLSGVFYWLTQDGTVLGKTDHADDLPLVLIEKDPNLNVGQVFQQEESTVIMPLLMGLKLHVIDFKLIRIVSLREIEIWLQGQILVLFNGEKDLESQLDSLQLILSRAKIEGKSIKKIDLRFDKPVIN